MTAKEKAYLLLVKNGKLKLEEIPLKYRQIIKEDLNE